MDLKMTKPVGGIERGFHGALRMRHQAGDIAFAIADAGDIVHGAVGISGGVIGTVRCRVTEKNLFVLFEFGDGGFVSGVAAVGVRDGNFSEFGPAARRW